ncbi:MAG: hypothetical protein KDA20_11620 [Phycisphaerales bacterium]|nr:hypothetical protein [Phycisphaerales bacterium]
MSDANWVSSRIDCDIYGCRLRIDATLTTADFRDFLRDLEAAIEGGTATFETIEDWLRLKFVVQGTGRAIVEGEVGNPGWPTLRLRFEFESDQTYFRETIRELRAVCASFPVIEKV